MANQKPTTVYKPRYSFDYWEAHICKNCKRPDHRFFAPAMEYCECEAPQIDDAPRHARPR